MNRDLSVPQQYLSLATVSGRAGQGLRACPNRAYRRWQYRQDHSGACRRASIAEGWRLMVNCVPGMRKTTSIT
jgi:hypothetical protein